MAINRRGCCVSGSRPDTGKRSPTRLWRKSGEIYAVAWPPVVSAANPCAALFAQLAMSPAAVTLLLPLLRLSCGVDCGRLLEWQRAFQVAPSGNLLPATRWIEPLTNKISDWATGRRDSDRRKSDSERV